MGCNRLSFMELSLDGANVCEIVFHMHVLGILTSCVFIRQMDVVGSVINIVVTS